MSDLNSSAARTWTSVSATAVRLFHEYANWLVSISWKRFFVLSVLLLVLAAILQHLPPFRWSWSEEVEDAPSLRVPRSARTTPTTPTTPVTPTTPTTPATPTTPPTATTPTTPPAPGTKSDKPGVSIDNDDVTISINKDGVRITPRRAAEAASAAASAASGAAAAAGAASQAALSVDKESVQITLPGASREAIREVIVAAQTAAREAAEEARQQADEARQDADEARRDAAEARQYKRVRIVHFGDSLTDLALLFIVASAILKYTYKGRMQAEVKAAEATETAESEQLKRQVVEARMAAMQAQVEPHFLFNTLASIDHLIETDPARASVMQKNLIALLRASMPTMRENHPAAHNLGREMAVIKPYLEILKVRMEDRLQTEINVPEGLMSADFPSMMIQSLVENAIKHGLEPKPEGGLLSVRAEIVHGKLAVTVADTGLGFGKAATAGTGIGLNNIRERLQLLYGSKASMTVAENAPTGTLVTLTVPYQAQTREGETA